MSQPSVLIADDEASVLITLGEILRQRGFKVTTAASVPQALGAMASQSFDALISDLNMGEPSDGFTLISAMRREQPQAVTVLITGFPDFDSAWLTMRNHVDECVIKPAEPAQMIHMLHQRILQKRQASPRHQPCPKTTARVLQEHLGCIAESWLESLGRSEELARLELSREELLQPILSQLSELIQTIEISRLGHARDPDMKAAFQLGQIRSRQGYTSMMLAEEARLLTHSIFNCLQANLLEMEPSQLLRDMANINDESLIQLKAALNATSVPRTWEAA